MSLPLSAQIWAPLSSPSCNSRPTNGLNLCRNSIHPKSCSVVMQARHEHSKANGSCNEIKSLRACLCVYNYNLPFHGPNPRSHHALPASGGPGSDRSWQLNEQQHSSQHMEHPRLIWQYWYYSGRDTFKETFVKINVFFSDSYWLRLLMQNRQLN